MRCRGSTGAGLVEVETSLFDESLLAKVPRFLRRKIDQLKYKVLAAIDRREKLIYIDNVGIDKLITQPWSIRPQIVFHAVAQFQDENARDRKIL